MEEQSDGVREVAAVELLPKGPPENTEGLHDDGGGAEPVDEGWEDAPKNRV